MPLDTPLSLIDGGGGASAAEGQQIRLAGRVDVITVADFRALLHAAIDGGSGVLRADVSELELVDAAGLGVLLGAHRRALRRNRALVLTGVRGELSRLLFRSRLYRVLSLEREPAETFVPVPRSARTA